MEYGVWTTLPPAMKKAPVSDSSTSASTCVPQSQYDIFKTVVIAETTPPTPLNLSTSQHLQLSRRGFGNCLSSS